MFILVVGSSTPEPPFNTRRDAKADKSFPTMAVPNVRIGSNGSETRRITANAAARVPQLIAMKRTLLMR
jgi:hypothetical protein